MTKIDPTTEDLSRLIDPEIVKSAHLNGTVKQYLNLYLHGDLTYVTAVEKMVISLVNENRQIKTILTRHLKETPQVILGLTEPEKKKFKKLLPKTPSTSCLIQNSKKQ